MKRRTVIKTIAGAAPAAFLSRFLQDELISFLPAGEEAFAKGPFKPDWESLKQYKTPDWFINAKFGIWAHWGPQCQPERGDWYARHMYDEGSDQYRYHVEKYGHPSEFGFKDVIHEWKAEKWNPDELLALYKKAGAQYFVALANHHDNMDLYDSKHQPWNSVKVGPKKDLVGGWAKAARKHGLHFGVSVHAAHAWSWMETAQRSDKKGPKAGIPYDGNVTKADGKGKWWDGMDPQELYAQNHPLSKNSENTGTIHSQWNWGNGVTPPSKAYCEKFYKRTIELINKYDPKLVYFDDTVLPLWPVSDAGLRIAAHMYNRSIKKHGKLEAVINGKILDEEQRKTMVWDIERGQSDKIEPLPWQTCTCIGSWHYDRRIYDNNHYKSAKTVIHMLADIVSKNGNLLLSVPLRGDGSLDDKARKTVEGIADWMQVNSEAIVGTRPWKTFGEGPSLAKAAPLTAQGFNEGKAGPSTHEDVRFTSNGDTLYAIVMGRPANNLFRIKSLKQGNQFGKTIASATLLGTGSVKMTNGSEALTLEIPASAPDQVAYVFKLS